MTPEVLVVIQARLGSTRLPSKVLLPLNGKPVLQHVVERCQRTGYPAVVALPASDLDPRLNVHGTAIRCPGETENVLGRYAYIADAYSGTELAPDIIVRITADCPCVDPALIKTAVQAITRGHDYAGNTRVRSYPRGLDVEAFSADQLGRTHRQAKSPYDREHVTPFMQVSANRPYDMVLSPQNPLGLEKSWRWTLDTPEDYRWLSGAFSALGDPTIPVLADYSRLHPPPRD